MADTENMNCERAEAHLRLLAEEELRRAAILVPDGAAGRPPGEAMRRASVTGTLAGGVALPDAVMASGGARSAGRGGTGLYSVHYRALVRLAALLVRDTRAAEQVVQDAFAALRHGGASAGGHRRGTGLSPAGCGEPVTSGPAQPVSSGPPAAPGGQGGAGTGRRGGAR